MPQVWKNPGENPTVINDNNISENFYQVRECLKWGINNYYKHRTDQRGSAVTRVLFTGIIQNLY